MSVGRSGPGVRSGFLETPRTRFGGVFLASGQTASQSAVPGASTPRVRRRSEAVDVDHGQLVYPSLKDCPVVMDLHELSPVGGRAACGKDERSLEWLAELREDLSDGPSSVMNAMNRMSPPHPGHSSGNSSPTRAISFAHAARNVSCERGFARDRLGFRRYF